MSEERDDYELVRREMLAGRPFVPGNEGHEALSRLRSRLSQAEEERDEAREDRDRYIKHLEDDAAMELRLVRAEAVVEAAQKWRWAAYGTAEETIAIAVLAKALSDYAATPGSGR